MMSQCYIQFDSEQSAKGCDFFAIIVKASPDPVPLIPLA